MVIFTSSFNAMAREFREIQRFNQWWIYVIPGISLLIMLIIGILPLHDKHGELIRFSDILIPLIGFVLTGAWVLSLRLATIVNEQGIDARFKAMPFAHKTFSWAEIEKAEVLSYSPLAEYGGWGLRYGFSAGWCYNVRGKTGLKLRLKNGKQFMIGTQQPGLLKQTLNIYFHPHEPGL